MQTELEETLRIYKIQTIDYTDEEMISQWRQAAHTNTHRKPPAMWKRKVLILNPEFLVLQFCPAGGTQSQRFAYIISSTPGKAN